MTVAGAHGVPSDASLPCVYSITFPEEAFPVAKQYWQHTGQGLSSRQAEYYLAKLRSPSNSSTPNFDSLKRDGDMAMLAIKQRLAEAYASNTTANDVYVFPSGMSAIYTSACMVASCLGHSHAMQFGFPYLDTLKLLQRLVFERVTFLGDGRFGDLRAALSSGGGEVSGIWTEFPSNPLLKCPSLDEIFALLKEKHPQTALIVDDTIGNPWNTRTLPHVDVVVGSLTKIFSGASNVMGGR